MGRVKRWVLKELTPQEMRRFVRLLRKILGVHNRKYLNILEVFEALRKIFPRLRIRIVEDQDLEGADARAYPAFWIIKLRKGIYEGLLRGDRGARWTFAHELGHVLLRHPGRPYRNRDETSRAKTERQAHMFAAELLAPADLALEYESPEEIGAAFRLSTDAARARFWEVKLADLGDEPNTIEDLASLLLPIIRNSISEARLTTPSLEPWKDNLFCTVLLVSSASQLLLEAYSSVRQKRAEGRHLRAACVVAAIQTILPIREIGSQHLSSRTLVDVNQRCALNAATALLELSIGRLNSTSRGALDSDLVPTCDFLQPFMEAFQNKVDASAVLSVNDLPTYHDYNGTTDITWREVLGLERLARYLALWTTVRISSS